MKSLWSILFCIVLCACQHTDPNTLRIGTVAGPETELVKAAQSIAESRYGLHIQIIEFNDYNLPNQALQDGSIDANVYQHLPYLLEANRTHGYDLISIGKTFVYPLGVYSQRYKSITAVPEHASIAIPNDPSNQARALELLQQAHLITLNAKTIPTVHDVVTNPHALQFKELDAAQLPRVLADVDAAVINTTFAIPAGLQPQRDALLLENAQSPYANVVAIKNHSTKQLKIQQFIEALHDESVITTANRLFPGAAIPAWIRAPQHTNTIK